jgi:hypothetical protein
MPGFVRTLIAAHLVAGLAAAGAALSSAPAQATSLTTYYKTLIAVRKCELPVEDDDVAKLQEAIENKVTALDASSDTINSIFDDLAAEVGTDTEAFCSDFGDEALEILSQL